jgi:hypothetical protein
MVPPPPPLRRLKIQFKWGLTDQYFDSWYVASECCPPPLWSNKGAHSLGGEGGAGRGSQFGRRDSGTLRIVF